MEDFLQAIKSEGSQSINLLMFVDSCVASALKKFAEILLLARKASRVQLGLTYRGQ